MNKQVL